MKFDGITVLLPAHGWDELASLGSLSEANALLCGATTPWHPSAVHAVAGIPKIQPIYGMDRDMMSQLVIVPPTAASGLDGMQLDRSNRLLTTVGLDRESFSHALLNALELTPKTVEGVKGVNPEQVRDFWTLGYFYFQLRLLTYRMHYSSGLDETALGALVVRAAGAAIEGDVKSSRRLIDDAYDMLISERTHYYPVDSYLLDIVLVTESTRVEATDLGLGGTTPLSLLMTGRALQRLAEKRPTLMTALGEAAAEGQVCLLGGELAEPPWFLMSCESVLASLRLGREVFRQIVGTVPTLFARRRFGLSPLVAQTLVGLGYQGTIQTALDAGRYPTSRQPRSCWGLPDDTSIKALGKLPLDARDALAMAKLGAEMADSMDGDYLATVSMVRWADNVSHWFDDFRHGALKANVLGKLATLADYFQTDCHQVPKEAFESDRILSPYLKQGIAKRAGHPISFWVAMTTAQLTLEESRSLAALASALGQCDADFEHHERIATEMIVGSNADPDQIGQVTSKLRSAAGERLARGLAVDASAAEARGKSMGMMLINPLGFRRRLRVRTEMRLRRPAEAIAWCLDDDGIDAVVEVPSCGFVFLMAAGDGDQTDVGSDFGPARLAEGLVLRNGFLEAHIHPDTGGIRAIYDYHTRGNRASQRLVCRSPFKFPKAAQARTVATSIELIRCNEVSASIRSHGKLFIDDNLLGGFQQIMTVVRGQRCLELELKLDIEQGPEGDPWQNYWCSTLALPDSTADLFRAVNWQRTAWSTSPTTRRLESSWYVDWVQPHRKTTLVAGGLPFHVAHDHFLDTILCVEREQARDFRLGIAIDAPDSLRESLDFLSPPFVCSMPHAPPTLSGWLLHVDALHVIVTAVEPLIDLSQGVTGLRVRLLEANGGCGIVTIRAFQSVSAAQQCDFSGKPLRDCELYDGAARLAIKAHEWTQVELHW